MLKKVELSFIIKIFIAVISIMLGAVAWFYNPHRSKIERLEKEIPKYKMVEIDDQITSVVDSLFVERGFTYIKLINHHKVALPPSRNHVYDPAFIGDQLKVGQRVVKRSGSDTITLKMGKDEMRFRIGEIINE